MAEPMVKGGDTAGALRARERQQATVAYLGQQGLAGTDLPGLMNEAVTLVAQTLSIEYVKVLELLPAGDVLLLRAGVGWKDGLVGRTTVGAEARSQAGYTLLASEPVVVDNLRTEPRFDGPSLLHDHGVVSGASVIISGNGKPYGVLGAHSSKLRRFTQDDVHFLQAVANVLSAAIERKRAEMALQESEGRYRSLYLAVSGGVVVQDVDGVVIDANEAACETLGLTLGQLRGRTSMDPAWDAIHEDGTPFPGEDHPAMVALRTGEPVRDVVMGIHHPKAMGRRWILVNSQPVLDPSGNGARTVVTTFVDITDRKQVTEKLQFLTEMGGVLASSLEYETTLASVARLSVPRIADWCTMDVIGEDGLLRRLAVAHVDPTREQMAHELHLRYPCDPNAPYGVSKVLRSGEPELYPSIPDSLLKLAARDEEHLEVLRGLGIRSAMVVPLVARGRTLGAIGLVSAESGRRYDAGDLALAEDLARLAALAVDNARLYRDAQKAIDAREEFLSIAAHELKTPMTSLRGFTQLVARQLDRDRTLDPALVRQSLQMIDLHSKKLAHLVSQLLDVSRMEAGRLKLDRRMANLARLVEGVVVGAQGVAPEHSFRLRLPPSATALVDPVLVERVVANLVDNAIKYSPNGGAIDVELSTTGRETVRLVVRDRGIGIPLEEQGRIFDRYYRGPTDGVLGGMGLGLYISHEIVRLHGGKIDVEAPDDGGTRFVVSLPTGFAAAAA